MALLLRRSGKGGADPVSVAKMNSSIVASAKRRFTETMAQDDKDREPKKVPDVYDVLASDWLV